MTIHLPPIVKTSERLLLEVEQAARRFDRAHKYTFGNDLRALAMRITMLSHRSWRERDQRATLLAEMDVAVQQMKLSLQIGSRLRAFSSFGQFEALARIASELGQQIGGWKGNTRIHPNGQNAARSVAPQRP